jgi:phosphoribosyl-ATP pyrophosphohydrolase/phosphoribosyl-AMP cyclohydrolase
MVELPADIQFGSDGLVPAIVQDASDGTVLMLAYMNRDALDLTLQTGYTHFWSRSRQRLWKKGETSGHVQRVLSVRYDCDGDAVLMQVEQTNVACHTGQRSCFFRAAPLAAPLASAGAPAAEMPTTPAATELLDALYELILLRRDTSDGSSYVQRLFQRGQDVMCKKVVEEAAEVLLASKNGDPSELIYEMADLWFHALVLLGHHTIHPREVLRELQRRFGRPGGGKEAPVAYQPATPFKPSEA